MANRQRMLKVDTCVFMDPDTARFFVRACGWVYYQSGRQWVDEMVPCPEGATRKEARELHRQILADRRAGFWRPERYAVRREVPRIRELVEMILADKADPSIGARRSRTIEHWRNTCAYWLDELGDFPADRLEAVDVQQWWAAFIQRKSLSNDTKNRALSYLATVLERAIALGYRANNPALSVERLRPTRKERRPAITLETWRRIFQALVEWDIGTIEASQPFRALVTGDPNARGGATRACYMGHAAYAFLQATLAARGHEICGIDRHKDLLGDRVVLRDTKTGPTLERDLSPIAVQVVENHLKLMDLFSEPAMRQSPYLFPARNGNRANPTSRIRKSWKAAMKAVDGKWVPHDLRRVGINTLYTLGGEEREIMEWVGHKSATAHAAYLRADPARRRALAEGLSARLSEL